MRRKGRQCQDSRDSGGGEKAPYQSTRHHCLWHAAHNTAKNEQGEPDESLEDDNDITLTGERSKLTVKGKDINIVHNEK